MKLTKMKPWAVASTPEKMGHGTTSLPINRKGQSGDEISPFISRPIGERQEGWATPLAPPALAIKIQTVQFEITLGDASGFPSAIPPFGRRRSSYPVVRSASQDDCSKKRLPLLHPDLHFRNFLRRRRFDSGMRRIRRGKSSLAKFNLKKVQEYCQSFVLGAPRLCGSGDFSVD